MLSKPKISIITVCYNSAKTILDTIDAVSQQDYPNKEHIIIDGVSTDGTLDILYKNQMRFDKWVSERDKGIYDAMNKGIQMASGDIVGFLNADDIFYDTTVLSQIASAFSDEAIEAVYGNLIYVAQNDLNKIVRYWRSSAFLPKAFSKGWCPPHPTFYVKKTVYNRLGGFDLSLPIANDVELMMRFLEKAGIHSKHIDKLWVKMRMGGISNRSLKNILHQNYIILKSLKKYDLPASLWRFMVCKFTSRLMQLCRRAF